MRALLLALFLLVAAKPAYAEGGLFDVNPGLSIWTVVIFLVVLGVLSKFVFPKILKAVEDRERRLEDLLAQAERDRAEAAGLLERQRAEMEQLRARTAEALAESRVAGERLREEILADARREQESMLVRAQQEISRETERALAEVRRDAVELSLAAAERVIGRNMSNDDNRRLVREFLGADTGYAAGNGATATLS